MKFSNLILALRISLVSGSMFLALMGLNSWTGYNVELGNWTVAQLHFLQDVLIYLNFVCVRILGFTKINQILNLNDPMSWPFVVRLQFMLIAYYILFFTGCYTISMYPLWTLTLGPVWWLIGTVYRYTVPQKYDALVEDYYVTFIGVSLYSCMAFTLILFFHIK